MNYVKQNKPEVYQKGIELIKDSDLLNEVRKFYPELSEENLLDEALAEAIGKQGIGIFNDQNKMICDKKFELVAGSR